VATHIRLARGGKHHRPYYRIVVTDSRSPRDGKFIERIGSYDPLLKENKATVNTERAKHWLDVGARPSHRVSKLLALHGMEHKLIELPSHYTAATAPAQPAAAEKPKGKAKADAGAAEEPKAAAAEKPAKGKGKAAKAAE
jgi:small subunit ribosomal protein S16